MTRQLEMFARGAARESTSHDIRAVRTTMAARCGHCAETIAAREIVHLLDHGTVAHVECDLRARSALRWAEMMT